MKRIQKRYKAEKLQNILQKQFFFFQIGNLSAKKLAELKLELKKKSIETNKIKNSLVKKLVKSEEYNIITNFVQGPLTLGYVNNSQNLLENLVTPIKNLTFLSVKINSNFYNKKEIENTFINSSSCNQNLLTELTKNSKILGACFKFKLF
jgi:ribosomal protein L10